MHITWVTRSFLDYRIPVYEEINRLCNNQLTVIYNADVVPTLCQEKLKKILGIRAKGLHGELRIGGKKIQNQAFANTGGFRIPLQPGLIKIVKKSKPDIILSDGFFQWTYAALINKLLWETPHIMCYERTSHTERNVSILRATFRKYAAKYISAICCNGIQTKEYLIKNGFDKRILFIGNMAADSKGLIESAKKTSPDEINHIKKKYDIKGLVFLYVGQIIPRKGIKEMLQAWQIFQEKEHESTLVLLGEGEQKNEAINYIKKNKIERVSLLGKVEYSEVAKFYAAADCFIIPTLEDNWSLVVAEAMSCSLPIICSKYNGCWPELVKPENGWVFDPLDQENFISTLKIAWDNRHNWEFMGNESFRIVQDYTPEKVSERIYKSCIIVINKLK